MNTNSLKSYFIIALELIPDKQLKDLFANLGYSEPISPELCLAAFRDYGSEFGVPFGSLAKDAFDSDAAKILFQEAAARDGFKGRRRIAKATGEKLTPQEKEETAFKWVSFVTDSLLRGADSVKGIMDTSNGTNADQAAAALAQAQAMKAQSDAKNTRMLIIGGAVLLVVIVIVILLVSRRK